MSRKAQILFVPLFIPPLISQPYSLTHDHLLCLSLLVGLFYHRACDPHIYNWITESNCARFRETPPTVDLWENSGASSSEGTTAISESTRKALEVKSSELQEIAEQYLSSWSNLMTADANSFAAEGKRVAHYLAQNFRISNPKGI